MSANPAKQGWDWRRALPSWTWHSISVDEFPGWDKPDAKTPASVLLEFKSGDGKQSREIAIKWDDACIGAFYYRDFTEDGIPFVRPGDLYKSRFWFQIASEAEEFAKQYGNLDQG